MDISKVATVLMAGALLAALVAAGNQTAQAQACDPSYPDFCIEPPPPDLNCGDIPYRNIHVLQPDPHSFDGNNDGIGCESDTYGPGIEPSAPTEPPPPAEEVGSTPTPESVEEPTPAATVLGVTSAPAAPNSGFGPEELAPASPIDWLAFALLGAGVAWLIVGLSGAVIQAAAPYREPPKLKPSNEN